MNGYHLSQPNSHNDNIKNTAGASGLIRPPSLTAQPLFILSPNVAGLPHLRPRHRLGQARSLGQSRASTSTVTATARRNSHGNIDFDHTCLPRRRFVAQAASLTLSTLLLARVNSSAAADAVATSGDNTNPSPDATIEGTVPQRRTVFDEERERNQDMLRMIDEQRLAAVRAAFDAIGDTKQQLADIDALIADQDWNGVSSFLRLYNNNVVRESMAKVVMKMGNSLDRSQRTEALALCKYTTEALVSIDKRVRELSKLPVDQVGTADERQLGDDLLVNSSRQTQDQDQEQQQLMSLIHQDVDTVMSLIDDFLKYKP